MLSGDDGGQLRSSAQIEAAQGAQPEHTQGAQEAHPPRASEALGQPGDPSRGRSQESRQRGDWKDKPLGGAGAGEEAGRALWGPRGAGRVVTLPGRSGGVQTEGARHRGAGVITGPKAGQRLQVPSPRDPSVPALVLSSGHVQRAVTQDPSRVEHAAATALRVSVISDQGALTVTLHRPLAAAHSHSKAPCTEALRLCCCGQAGQTPLHCTPTAHPTGGRPGCGGKTPARGPDAPSPPPAAPLLPSVHQGAQPQGGWCHRQGSPPSWTGSTRSPRPPRAAPPTLDRWSRKLKSKEGRTRPRSAELRGKEGTGEGRGKGEKVGGVGDKVRLKRPSLSPAGPGKGHTADQGPVATRAVEAAHAGSAETAGRSSRGSKWQW